MRIEETKKILSFSKSTVMVALLCWLIISSSWKIEMMTELLLYHSTVRKFYSEFGLTWTNSP